MKKSIKEYLFRICKVFAGITFCTSAVLKLFSIDSFELYIYSFPFAGLVSSYIISHGIICVELILGISLILNLWKKLTYLSSLLLLFVFTIFLFVLIFNDNQDNCHCFGETIKLNPVHSVIKNSILIILLLLSKNKSFFYLKHERKLFFILSAVVTVSIFVLFPPDNYSRGYISGNVGINEAALNEAFDSAILDKNNFVSGKKIICFYGTSCKHCKLSAQRLSIMQKKNIEPDTEIIGVFLGSEKKCIDFIESFDLNYSKTYLISPDMFLKITNGKMPVIITIENGKIIN